MQFRTTVCGKSSRNTIGSPNSYCFADVSGGRERFLGARGEAFDESGELEDELGISARIVALAVLTYAAVESA